MDKEKYAIAEGLVAKSRLRKHCQKNEIEFSVKALYIVATLHSHAHVIYYFEGEFNNDEFKKNISQIAYQKFTEWILYPDDAKCLE